MAACPRLRFATGRLGPQARSIHAYAAPAGRRRKFEGNRADVETIGKITIAKRDPRGPWHVHYVEVNEKYRRCGLATRLYERAAALACRLSKKGFASDFLRTKASDAFWQKQVAKGRATCAEPFPYARPEVRSNTPDRGRNACAYYLMPCPAPAALDGVQPRRRR